MKTKLMGLGIALLAGASMFAQPRVSIGVGIGGYAPGTYGPAYAQRIPPRPGPGFVWVDGYWSQSRGHRTWVSGYWQRAPRYEQRYRGDYRNNNDQRYNNDYRRDNDRGYGNGYRNR